MLTFAMVYAMIHGVTISQEWLLLSIFADAIIFLKIASGISR